MCQATILKFLKFPKLPKLNNNVAKNMGCLAFSRTTHIYFRFEALLLELLAHKPAGEVAADIVAHDGPEPSAEHRHLELAKNEC